MKFQGSKAAIDDDGSNWQNDELKKLEIRCTELIVENETLKTQLTKKKYEETYRDNLRMQMELKNMYILQEENKDLREDLERLQSMTYEQRMKDLAAENE